MVKCITFHSPLFQRVLLLCLISAAQQTLSAKVARLRCFWRGSPSTTMVIGWDQISGQAPVVFYGTADAGQHAAGYPFQNKPDRVVSYKEMNNHFARLQNLLPNTVYFFIIKDTEGSSKRYSFKTASDNPEERVSIIAGGDSRNHREARLNSNTLVSKLRPHFILFNGDMTDDDTAEQWKEWFDDWQITFGADGRIFPIVPARGNHETSNQILLDLFDAPHPQIFYGLTFGGNLLRVYTLNSMIPSGGEQKAWLEKDLRENTGTLWKFAQYHLSIRPHTQGKPKQNELLLHWATLFKAYSVKVAFESDAHVAKWTYPIRPSKEPGSDDGFIRDDENGTVYAGEGGWGAPLRENNIKHTWTKASGSFNQFDWVFVDAQKVEIRKVMTDCAKQAQTLTDKNLFTTPVGLALWKPQNGDVVLIQASRKNSTPLSSSAAKPASDKAEQSSAFVSIDPASQMCPIRYTLPSKSLVVIQVVDSKFRECWRKEYPDKPPGTQAEVIPFTKLLPGEYTILIKTNGKLFSKYKTIKE